VLFLIISGLGFERGLKWIGRFGVPAMIVLVLVAVIATIQHAGVWEPSRQRSRVRRGR